MDRHRSGYFDVYKNRTIEQALIEYGNRCYCIHCIHPIGVRPLQIILEDEKIIGTYKKALFLKRLNYKQGLAKLFCLDCYPRCNHAYKRTIKHSLKNTKNLKKLITH
jgi:hypothetical protein